MDVHEPARLEVASACRTVIKVGTRVITHDDGRVALSRLFAVVEAAAALAADREVLIVSSGAVGLGKDALGFEQVPAELRHRQACAAVGQTRLMGLYEEGFSRLGRVCGQVLLTQSDFDHRLRYLNLRSTLLALLSRGVIPVINENDAVSTEELAYDESEPQPVFGDNDRLSALVATKLGADLLVLLTDVDGVYDSDPRCHPDARLVSRIETPGAGVDAASGPGSELARGGMRSKVEAAHLAARAGSQAVIASGVAPGALDAVLAGGETGTWFPARGELAAKRRWIAFAAKPRGSLELDVGAVRALTDRGASLLAAGVRRVAGDFDTGDVVELRGPGGVLIGRGIVHCDAGSARAWCGGTPPAGIRNHHALVHRDHLVLEN